MGKRFLTSEEINYICSVIPDGISPIDKISKNIKYQLVNKLHMKLSEIKLDPLGIDDLRNEIFEQYENSIAVPGTPIGITTGEAIGQQQTQMNLNTFHVSGSSKTLETKALGKLLSATSLDSPTTTIHFKNKELSVDDITKYEKDISETTIKSLFKSKPEIINNLPISERGWWYSNYCTIKNIDVSSYNIFLRISFNIEKLYEYDISLSDISLSFESNFIYVQSPLKIGIIDLYLNSETILNCSSKKVYDLIITDKLIEICFDSCVIKSFNFKIVKGIKGFNNLYPISVNTMNIVKYIESISQNEYIFWINKLKIIKEGITYEKFENFLLNYDFKILEKNLSLNFFKVEITPNWLDIFLPRIFSKLFNDKILVTSFTDSFIEIDTFTNYFNFLFSSESYSIKSDKISITFNDSIFINDFSLFPLLSKKGNIGTYKLPNNWFNSFLFEKLSFLNISNITDTKIFLNSIWSTNITNLSSFITSYNLNDNNFFSIENYIQILYDIEISKKKLFIKTQKLNGILSPEYFNSRISSYFYVYAEIIGSNLTDLFQHPDIDSTYSITNNISEVFKLFDIETARNMIAIFCDNIIKSNDSYINGRHILFLSDFMTNSGTVIPITSKGIARTNRGVFADASFEQPIDFFIKSALIGKPEKANFTSPSIFMGKRMAIGTGSLLLKLNESSFKYLDSLFDLASYRIDTSSSYDFDSSQETLVQTTPGIDTPIFNEPPSIIPSSDIPNFLSNLYKENSILEYTPDKIKSAKISEESIENFLNFKF